ncbi:MAG: zinc ribbon domain-containing protein [Ruminococcaceae bacterium]|nr:zinc ribbon domain-containing protein [Oscillospiraceae bacterium]
MFCKHCGKQIDNSANACPYCGTAVTRRNVVPNAPSNINNASAYESGGVTQAQQSAVNNRNVPPADSQTKGKKAKKQGKKSPAKTAKKIFIAIIALILVAAIGASAFVVYKIKKQKDEEAAAAKLTDILKESTTKPVIDMYCKDYDSDGTYEAYAVVGQTSPDNPDDAKDDAEYYEADIFYVSEKRVQPIKENITGKSNGLIEANDRIYISIEIERGEDESYSYIYTVEEEQPAESEASGKHSEVHQEGKDIFANGEEGSVIEIEIPEGVVIIRPLDEILKIDNIDSAVVGDIVEFGSYPQTKVTDEAVLSQLNSASAQWVSYGYYSGDETDGSMLAGDWMQYADVTIDGEKYRGVTFSEYRPGYTTYPSSAENSNQDDNGYVADKVYWFKYEPLQWRVIDPAKGLIVCENIIDSQAYSDTLYRSGANAECYSDEDLTAYASEYANSSIRKWLNETFFTTAFSADEQAKIAETVCTNKCVNNENFNSADTKDKIFLLSYEEVTAIEYGFAAGDGADVNREAVGTDYARCQGLRAEPEHNDDTDEAWWSLRTCDGASGYSIVVSDKGDASFSKFTNITYQGVRPALCIK